MGKGSRIKQERRIAEKSVQLTRAEQKAKNKAIREQILALEDEFYKNEIFVILYAVHEIYGFGPKRLKRFFDKYTETHEQLREWYGFTYEEGRDTDITNWLSRRKLVEYGCDVDAWLEEYNEKLRKEGRLRDGRRERV